MTLQQMTITGVLYDDAAETLIFELDGAASPPPPAGVDPDYWNPRPMHIRSQPLPVRKGVVTQPVGEYVLLVDGRYRYYRVTWTGTAWSSPIETNINGVPL